MTTDPEAQSGSQPYNPAPAVSANGAVDPSSVPSWKLLLRGLLGRCPVCGGRGLFPRFLEIRARCPRCGYNFERESGWWLGAMTMNVGAATLLFMAFFIGGMLLTYPDVPWTALSVIGIGLMIVFPIVFTSVSKTLWIALEIVLRRMG